MAVCNDLTKREAQVLIKRKFPPTEAVGLRRGARGKPVPGVISSLPPVLDTQMYKTGPRLDTYH